MIATENASAELKRVINEATGDPNVDPILYVYGSHMFVSWSEVRAYAIENKADHILYETVFGKNNTVEVVAEKKADENGAGAVAAVYSNDETSPDYLWNKWYNTEHHNNENALKEFKKLRQTLSSLFISLVKTRRITKDISATTIIGTVIMTITTMA